MTNPYSYQASVQISQELGAASRSPPATSTWGPTTCPATAATSTRSRRAPSPPASRSSAGRRVRRARQLPRHRQHGHLHVPRRHPRAEEAVRGAASASPPPTRSPRPAPTCDSVTNLGDLPGRARTSRARTRFSRQHVPPPRHPVVHEPGARRTCPCWATSSSRPWSPRRAGGCFTMFAGSDANGDGNPNSDRVGARGTEHPRRAGLPQRGRARGPRDPPGRARPRAR